MTDREDRMVVIKRDADGQPLIWCDPEIVDLITALNAAGIATLSSCSGHGFRPGYIALADGRWLFVATDSERAAIDEAFPVDINGVFKGNIAEVDKRPGRPNNGPLSPAERVTFRNLEIALNRRTEVEHELRTFANGKRGPISADEAMALAVKLSVPTRTTQEPTNE